MFYVLSFGESVIRLRHHKINILSFNAWQNLSFLFFIVHKLKFMVVVNV